MQTYSQNRVRPRTLSDVVPLSFSRTIYRDLVLVVGFSLFIALTAQIRIQILDNPVPITFQTLVVLLGGAALGRKNGLAGVALYLLEGLVGLPVFAAGGHGYNYLFGATGGYLFSYLVVAFVTGWLAERRWDHKYPSTLALMLVGLFFNYLLGVTWLAVYTGKGLSYGIEKGMLPFLGIDLIKVVIAASLLPATWWLTRSDNSQKKQ